jgi:3-methylfumaryl-CoA hydratase
MELKDWIGRSETVDDVITPTPAAAMAATLDQDPARPPAGSALPPLWHWLYFLPLPRQSDIGPDGHAKRGGFLPPVTLPRRMWAGSRLTFGEPLRVGDAVRRISTIEKVEQKSGRSGALVFVTVRHEIGKEDRDPSVTELQDIVYREAAKPGEARQEEKRPAPAPAGAWEKKWQPDDVFLFRYSALLFNGHRIHYDRRYVTETEGYPGLIVHGPLIATLLVELLRSKLPQARLAKFEFRAVRPIFDLHPFFACGEPQGKSVHLWARDHTGALCMDASAVVE